ncbi:hypothetical protein JB92DRAFT_3082171 [Gautieria morchelliformis]|nr:hypothetical protein JB92DRAFT_3082171 [Gautieria morchelliformis]
MSDAPAAPVTANGAPQQAATEEIPGHKVFAGNLAYSTTDEALRAFFETAATDILSAQVIQRGTRSAGYGFVAFSTLEAAEKAVAALDKKELDGRTIIIEVAKPTEQKDKERSERRAKRRAGRRGSKAPPGEVTEAEANGEADKAEGAASGADGTAKPKKKRNLRKKTKKAAKDAAGDDAAVTTDAVPATAENGEAAKKKTPRQVRKRTPRPAGEPPAGEPSQTVLFVANLGFTIDDAQLAELFTSQGIHVASARVVRKRWGTPRKSKGYGFVDVGSEEEQKKALAALQGKEVDGREIAVKIAVNAQDRDEAGENGEKGEGGATPEATILEEESRQEGLSKSLFERAREEEQTGAGGTNKAMAMMLKMGFKPGESLGRVDEPPHPKAEEPAEVSAEGSEPAPVAAKPSGHLVEPLPLDVWSGRLGVGKRKRAVSPTVAGKLAKVVQQADEEARGSYRERARQEYEEKRAEGRLVAATRTCVTLDEKAEKEFNVLWLNPQDPETFPPDLLEALTSDLGVGASLDTSDRLRQQMRADALQPLLQLDDDSDLPTSPALIQTKDRFPPQIVEESRVFIRLSAPRRLDRLLAYLRNEYYPEDLQQCPGLEEEDHD